MNETRILDAVGCLRQGAGSRYALQAARFDEKGRRADKPTEPLDREFPLMLAHPASDAASSAQ